MPIHIRELLARIRALLRRQEVGRAASPRDAERGRYGAAADDQDFMVRRPGHHGSPVELARPLWPRAFARQTPDHYTQPNVHRRQHAHEGRRFFAPAPPPRQNVACGGVGLIRLRFRGMLCRGLASWSDFVSGGTESSRTRRWREPDSNHRFLVRRSRFLLRKANCGGLNGGGLLKLFLCGVPMVRIHPPPAESLSLFRSRFRRSRTRLSARVCADGLATASAETPGCFDIAPTGGNVSVGPIPVPQ